MPRPVTGAEIVGVRAFFDAVLDYLDEQDAAETAARADADAALASSVSTVSAASTSGLATKAPLASPALTGTPTAPTAAPGTNTTQIATTAFVRAAVNALIAGLPGPYADSAAAATAGVAVGSGWIDTSGFVRRRLS